MSDQLVTLDETPGREWQLSELRTTVADGQADVEAFLDTPMRAADTHVLKAHLNSQLCLRSCTPPHHLVAFYRLRTAVLCPMIIGRECSLKKY